MTPYFFLVFIYFFTLIGDTISDNKIDDQKIHEFTWLEGTWKRTDLEGNNTGYEIWEQKNENQLSGKGFRLHAEDTVFIENILIDIKPGEAYYIVTLTDNPEPVSFKIIHADPQGFRSQNFSNDFPKQIVYIYKRKEMTVTKSGDGESHDFEFRKISK